MEKPKRSPQDPVMTAAGHKRLEAELDQVRHVRRPEVVERLHAARETGSWGSPEFMTVRDELALLDGRIAALERRLARAEVAKPVPSTD